MTTDVKIIMYNYNVNFFIFSSSVETRYWKVQFPCVIDTEDISLEFGQIS